MAHGAEMCELVSKSRHGESVVFEMVGDSVQTNM